MPSRKGVWLPLDCGFTDDERVIDAGEKAAWLYICMSLAAKRLATDGVLSASQVERLHVGQWQQRLARLLDTGLVLELEPGRFTIAGWFKHNDPVAVVQERRAKDAERKRSVRSDSTRTPLGVQTESVRSPNVEKRREEKSSKDDPSDGTALALRAAPTDVFAETRARLAARRNAS